MKKDTTHFSSHKLLTDAQIKKAITAELIQIKERLNPYFFRTESRNPFMTMVILATRTSSCSEVLSL